MVMITPAIPDHVRGYISRFLIEPRPNVFVGNCSSRVRDAIWERACSIDGVNNLTLIYSSSQREQGFEMRFFGEGSPQPIDLDGMVLVARHQLAGNDDISE